MDAKSGFYGQDTMLIVLFVNELLCNTYRDGQLISTVSRIFLADECGFVQRFQFPALVFGQKGHLVRVPENDLTFG